MSNTQNERGIFQTIDALNLPDGKYIVVGSGVLSALGLRKWAGDVDFAVSQDIYDTFVKDGWAQTPEATKTVLRYKDYDIGVGFGRWNLDDLLADALVIKGIPFVSPKKLIEWKRDRGLPKDQRDIKLIEEYLKTH